MSDPAPCVELVHAGKWFPDPRNGERLVAVQDVSFQVPDEEDGEFLVILGPSGCGKSTILRMLAGTELADEGEVRVFGRAVTGPTPECVTVPQAYTCFPWLTALGNVEFGLGIQGKPPAERRELASAYLERVGLGNRLNARPKELSGGMQQRVAIARALAMKPRVVLMDEPFGALDAQTRGDMQQLLTELWTAEKNLIIFITHDITEALLLADRIIVLSPRPAQIVYDAKVPFARPRSPEITRQASFTNMSQALLDLLKSAPAGGQVRVTV